MGELLSRVPLISQIIFHIFGNLAVGFCFVDGLIGFATCVNPFLPVLTDGLTEVIAVATYCTDICVNSSCVFHVDDFVLILFQR